MNTIYQVLERDHQVYRKLIKQILQTSGDTPERRQLWNQFYCDVKSHAAAEEESFYAPLMEQPEGQDYARHSVSEHKELDDLLDEVAKLDFGNPQWLKTFKQICHDYLHHIDEEEEEIFSRAQKLFSQQEAQAMGEQFEKRKGKERKAVDRKAAEKLTA